MTHKELKLAILQQFIDFPLEDPEASRSGDLIRANLGIKYGSELHIKLGCALTALASRGLLSRIRDRVWFYTLTERGLHYLQEKEQSMSTNNLSKQEQQQLFALLHKSLTPEQRKEALATDVDKEEEFYTNLNNFLGERLGGVFRNRNWMSRLTSKAFAFIVEDKDGDSHFEADDILRFNHLYNGYVCGWGASGCQTQKSPSEKKCEPRAFRVQYCESSGDLMFHEVTGIKLHKNGYTHILGDPQEFEVPQSLRGTQ